MLSQFLLSPPLISLCRQEAFYKMTHQCLRKVIKTDVRYLRSFVVLLELAADLCQMHERFFVTTYVVYQVNPVYKTRYTCMTLLFRVKGTKKAFYKEPSGEFPLSHTLISSFRCSLGFETLFNIFSEIYFQVTDRTRSERDEEDQSKGKIVASGLLLYYYWVSSCVFYLISSSCIF